MRKIGVVIVCIIILFSNPFIVKAEDVDKINDKHKNVVFLTFDDGPSSNNTPKILSILKEYNVKATFFVIGAKAEENQKELKELNDNGMAIFPHCYIHDYNKIYKSKDVYMDDLRECQKEIEKVTGRTNKSFIRFPGGSVNNWVNKNTFDNIKKCVKSEGTSYVDWNVTAEDAVSYRIETNRLVRNVCEGCKGCSVAVVLMHDSSTKTTTVEALPYIIKSLKNKGYEFKTFDDISLSEFNKMINLKIINR